MKWIYSNFEICLPHNLPILREKKISQSSQFTNSSQLVPSLSNSLLFGTHCLWQRRRRLTQLIIMTTTTATTSSPGNLDHGEKWGRWTENADVRKVRNWEKEPIHESAKREGEVMTINTLLMGSFFSGSPQRWGNFSPSTQMQVKSSGIYQRRRPEVE